MRDPEKILLGSSLYIMEIDDEEQENRIEEAIANYQMLIILSNINKSEFKEIYLNEISSVKLQSFDDQKLFCIAILDKIEQVYNFRFSINIDLDEKIDFINVYLFLEFLEYDNILFLTKIWRFLNSNLRSLDIENYCSRNSKKIINEIEDQLETSSESWLITKFLRTYNKDNLIDWFENRSKQSKMLIYLGILESEVKRNGRNND